MARTYRAEEIAEHLAYREHAAPNAAARAGKAIASAWTDREFYASATRRPLQTCADDSPEMTAPITEVLDRLARVFDVHIHTLAEWEPPQRRPRACPARTRRSPHPAGAARKTRAAPGTATAPPVPNSGEFSLF